MFKLDENDVRILRLMQEQGHLTSAEIADRVGMSQSPCWRRISRLEKEGVISKRLVLLDRKVLGFNLAIDVRIKLSEHGRQILTEIQEKLSVLPEVQAINLLLGEVDFALRIVVKDLDRYEQLLRNTLTQIPGVQEIRSSVILSEVKNSISLAI